MRKCPNCGQTVDWHREWYSIPDQRELAMGEAAMKCLRCGEEAVYDPETLTVKPASGEPLKERKEDRARAWWEAQMASEYPEGREVI